MPNTRNVISTILSQYLRYKRSFFVRIHRDKTFSSKNIETSVPAMKNNTFFNFVRKKISKLYEIRPKMVEFNRNNDQLRIISYVLCEHTYLQGNLIMSSK